MNLIKLEVADGSMKQLSASVQQSLAELLPYFDRRPVFVAGSAYEIFVERENPRMNDGMTRLQIDRG